MKCFKCKHNCFNNTAVGHRALLSVTTASLNTALGYNAGGNVTGVENICIGGQSGRKYYIRNI